MAGRPGAVQLVVASAEEEVQHRLLELVDRAGGRADVVGEASRLPAAWRSADLVLLDAELVADRIGGAEVAEAVDAALMRRAGVVLVTRAEPDQRTWQVGVQLGVEHVAVLPASEEWLVDRCAEVVAGSSRAVVVGVLGGCGGAGASVLATVLADQAAQRGVGTVLLDADPLGGGIDLALGAEAEPGLRWADLAGTSGRLPPSPLLEALPGLDGVRVLAFDRDRPVTVDPEPARSVLGGLRGAADLLVVDLPRSPHGGVAAEALHACGVVLLVVPAELRAVAAARRVADRVSTVGADLRLVVRGPGPTAMPAAVVGEALEMSCWERIRDERGLAAALERGEPLGRRRRSPLGRAARRMLAELLG